MSTLSICIYHGTMLALAESYVQELKKTERRHGLVKEYTLNDTGSLYNMI